MADTIVMGKSDTPGELVVRTVTVEHKKTKLHHRDHSSHAVPSSSDINNDSPRGLTNNPSVVMATPITVTLDKKEEEKQRKHRGGLCAAFCWCCPCCPLPFPVMVALFTGAVVIALGLGLGLGLKKTPDIPPPVRVYNLDIKFNIYGKEVNLTLVSQLRCLVANLTDPTQFRSVLMTSWEEYNGTTYFVEPNHPLNDAQNCSDYFPDVPARRRRLQMINDTWIFPFDPITVNISAVPPPGDVNYTFVDNLYNSEKLTELATIQAMQEQRISGNIPLPASRSPTPSRTPSQTPTRKYFYGSKSNKY